MTKSESNFKDMRIIKNLFIYWFILVIWQNINPNYSSRSFIDIIIKAIMLVYLIISFINKDIKIKKNNLLLWSVFSVYYILMMFFTTENLNFNIIIFYGFTIVFSFLVLVCHSNATIDNKSYNIFLKLYIIVALYMAVYALVYQWNYFVNFLSLNNAYGNELSSFLTSSHEYGMNMVFGIIASFVCLRSEWKTNKFYWIYAVFILIFGVNLILTFSRTSYLAIIVFFITYFIFTGDKKLKIKILIGLISLSIIICFNEYAYDYIFRILLKSNNDAGRFEMWTYALREYPAFPIINQFFGKGYEYISTGYLTYFGHDNLHNAFIQNLLMWGIFGLLYFFGIIIYGIKNAYSIGKYNKELSAIFIALIMCCIAFMFTNTMCIMGLSLNSFMLTIYTIIIPKYVENHIKVNSGGE